jgi:hypothetical protein
VILRRADEGRAALGDLALADLGVQRPAADAVARLEHDRRPALALDLPCGGEPREAGADDRDVGAADLAVPGRGRLAREASEQRACRRGGPGSQQPPPRDRPGPR